MNPADFDWNAVPSRRQAECYLAVAWAMVLGRARDARIAWYDYAPTCRWHDLPGIAELHLCNLIRAGVNVEHDPDRLLYLYKLLVRFVSGPLPVPDLELAARHYDLLEKLKETNPCPQPEATSASAATTAPSAAPAPPPSGT